MNPISRSVAERLLRSPNVVEAATVIAYAPGRDNDFGEWVDGASTETDVELVTAPMSGTERQQLPESLRKRNVRKFWTFAELAAVTPGENDGDQVRHKGIEYRIIRLNDWGGFRELIAVEPE